MHEAERIGEQAGSNNAMLLTTTLREWIGRARGGIPAALVETVRTAIDGYLAGNPEVCSARSVLLTFAIDAGDLAEARRQLDLVTQFGFGDRDAEWLGTLWRVTEACELFGDAELAATVAGLLEPFESRFAIDGIGAAVIGAVGEALGVLDLVRGQRREGEVRLQRAIERYEDIGAPLLATRARDRLTTKAGPATASPPERGSLAREGDVWALVYRGREVRLRDAKGLRDLASLLSQPNHEMHVSELTGGGVVIGTPVDAIDDDAKAAYRARIAELEAEVAEADDAHDLDRASRAREELEASAGVPGAPPTPRSGRGRRSRHGSGTSSTALRPSTRTSAGTWPSPSARARSAPTLPTARSSGKSPPDGAVRPRSGIARSLLTPFS